MSRYYSLETIRSNAYDVTLANGAKHRCIDPDALLDIEPADVRENVKGEWIDKPNREFCFRADFKTIECNQCGYNMPKSDSFASNYCPNCGADMRGEVND